jgi:hypothetical protein
MALILITVLARIYCNADCEKNSETVEFGDEMSGYHCADFPSGGIVLFISFAC